MVEQLPAIVVVWPLLAAFCVFFTGWWLQRATWLLVIVATGGLSLFGLKILATVLTAGPLDYHLGGWPPPWGIALVVDPLAAYMLALVSILSLLTAIWARCPVAAELADRPALFWSLFLLLVTGMVGIVITGDLFNLFVLLEVASITGYALVGMGRGPAPMAAFRYLILGTIGASFYLIGIGHLYVMTGSLNMADLQALLPSLYDTAAVRTAFVFMVVGLGIKIALFPLHAWQPDAYSHAPDAVSVILSTAMAKTSAYALIRVIFSVFSIHFINTIAPLFELLCWVAAAAMLAGSIFALRQTDLKRLLAYSSIANVGYIILAIGLSPANRQGLNPAVMHILNHAVIKGCMFMAAGAIIYRLGHADLDRLDGLGRRMPITCLALLLAILSMIGMPPSAGFATKWVLILAVLETGRYLFCAVIVVSTLLMIVYFWRLVEALYVRPVSGESRGVAGVGEVPASMQFPCALLGVASMVIGLVWLSGRLDGLLEAVNHAFGLGGA